MPLRTPRRRISPRTKRRYRVVRDFFRRALGSSSHPNIEINSSIAVNVKDLKQKIVGLEQQLSAVSKHCHGIICIESSTQQGSDVLLTDANVDINEQNEASSASKFNERKGIETKVLYKTSESHYKKSDESDYVSKSYDEADYVHSNNNNMNTKYLDIHDKSKKCKPVDKLNEYDRNPLHKYKTQSACQNFNSVCSASSFYSLSERRQMKYPNDGCPDFRLNKKKNKRENKPKDSNHQRDDKYIEQAKRNKCEPFERDLEHRHTRKQKDKREFNNLNEDFIADIIRRQYKPVKMFGRKESDLTQFSAPMCRDQEFLNRDEVQQGPDLCFFCYDDHHHCKRINYDDLSDIRSICDARLYRSNRNPRLKRRRMHVDVYNDSELYDLIPVKEKSSPKSRRKFVEENMIPYDFYREVPPSPRSHRPRLNLKAQFYTESDGHMDFVKHQSRRPSPSRPKRHEERNKAFESDNSLTIPQNKHTQYQKVRTLQNRLEPQTPKQEQTQQNTGTISNLQDPMFVNEQANVTIDTTLNNETDLSIDKTDKALCEIKDILQSFLHEIKKETTASQCDKSDSSTKITENSVNNMQQNKLNANVLPNSGHTFNNFTVPQYGMPSYMPTFPNTCCYPMLPVCPMNCGQNGYVMPSPSYTCANCVNNPKEDFHNDNVKANSTANETCNTETEKLIKEIYKFVAQSPTITRKAGSCKDNPSGKDNSADTKLLTSRSVGGSSKASKHDANVGTPKIKCYSKSCEAIGSRLLSDTYYSETNATYSDTILEKLSLEATATETVSETEFSTESTQREKAKGNKFAKVLQSFGLLKKKKNNVIEELSESESAVEVNTRNKPPFRQEITNYTMHGQEYYKPPPVPQSHFESRPPEDLIHPCRYGPPYDPRVQDHPVPPINDIYNSYRGHHTIHEHSAPYYQPRQTPTAPPCSYERYNQMHPQVPLCLKEIEVKSTGTQSERKMSFFRKVKNKMQAPGEVRSDPNKNCSTQTNQNKPGMFNWKNLHEKSKQKVQLVPLDFSFKTQKKLAEGDMSMRNAMLKKIFYKRNPFSPRNLIVRTLLGKDKSSFGAPPNIYKPRMFF